MNPPNPPPQLLIHVQSTIQILKQTTTVVFFTRHHFIISLLLSLLLLSYKLGAEFMTRHFYTSIDYDPSIQTYFAQIHNPTKPTNTTHLPGAGDFDSEISYQFFNDRPTILQTPNATPFTFDSYIPRLGLSRPKKLIFKLIMTQEKVNASLEIDYGTQNDQDLTLYLSLHLLARYVAAFLGFLFTRCCVHGVIFVLLVNALLRIHNPIFATFRRGTELGLRRLLEYTAVKCMIRHSLIHFSAVYFLGEMKDPHTGYMVFVRLNFMPFSIGFYPVQGFEEEVEFLVWWFFLEILLSSVFAMCACAFMVDETRTWWDRLREVCNLLSLNVFPVIWFKFLEIICGSIARFVSEQIVGQLFGFGMQFFVEVYFRVALMMYYFSVKSRDANRRGEPFGRREFEDMLIGI